MPNLDTRLFYVPEREMRFNLPMLERYGYTPDSPEVHPLEYQVKPHHDTQTQAVSDTNTVIGPDDSGTYHVVYEVVDLPADVALGNVKTAKLTELTTAFAAAEASGWLSSSLGFDIDATERANRDVAGLITAMSRSVAPETTPFCDRHNQMRPVTLANLHTMQLEIIAYGQNLYAQKWQIRTAIETAETVDAVQAVVIAFGAGEGKIGSRGGKVGPKKD